MTIKPKVGILEISPYVGGEAGLKDLSNIHKLSANEGALGPSPKAMEAINLAAKDMHRYPDGSAYKLRQTLGEIHGLNPNQILCGNGSDEIITLLIQSFAGAGDEVLYSKYGFLMYPITALTQGAIPVWADENYYTTDVDAILAKVSSRTKMVFIANPNNPTGTYLPEAEMRRLRQELPQDILLVIDAAYAEFVTANDYDCGIKLVNEFDNVVMTRTFSKAYALGGVRLGWCYANDDIIDILNRVRGPFNVNALALAAGVAALNDTAHLNATINHTIKWRIWLSDAISQIGLEVLPSQGNFILVRFSNAATADAAELALKNQGLIMRKMGGYKMPEALRITIGLADENQAIVKVLTEFMGK